MADCSEIGLLLGPFEDGELEPHEMQEVARHLARCPNCEAILADYNTLGRHLRDAVVLNPVPDDFAKAVQARTARLRPARQTGRLSGSVVERIAASLVLGLAAAAVAVVTAVVVTPYARQLMSRHSAAAQLASVQQKTTQLARTTAGMPANIPASKGKAPHTKLAANTTQNSSAIISRLESESPSVAVWHEPQTDTTVIWLPDQR
jgi:anti-sigma factor RsiW